MAFPEFLYVSLEDLQNRQEAQEDPRGFLRRIEKAEGVILDEVQRTPDLFSYLQGAVDDDRGGPYILTGSQQFQLSERISQSLAGRAAIVELLPFSLAELHGWEVTEPETLTETLTDPETRAPGPSTMSLDETLFTGLFPRIHDQGLEPRTWLDGYLRTYVERDVRTLGGVGDLDAFTRFLGLCAGRAGQLLNASSLASDVGVSQPTIKKWLSILRASYVIELLQPHHENFRKRLVKSPKLYFVDCGLLCNLLGLRHAGDLHRHPLRGAIVENFVVTELRKRFVHHGRRAPLYFWRDSNGREVDVVVELGPARVPIEVKAGVSIASDAFRGLDYYTKLSGGSGGILVYGGDESYPRRGHQIRAWWGLG